MSFDSYGSSLLDSPVRPLNIPAETSRSDASRLFVGASTYFQSLALQSHDKGPNKVPHRAGYESARRLATIRICAAHVAFVARSQRLLLLRTKQTVILLAGIRVTTPQMISAKPHLTSSLQIGTLSAETNLLW